MSKLNKRNPLLITAEQCKYCRILKESMDNHPSFHADFLIEVNNFNEDPNPSIEYGTKSFPALVKFEEDGSYTLLHDSNIDNVIIFLKGEDNE